MKFNLINTLILESNCQVFLCPLFHLSLFILLEGVRLYFPKLDTYLRFPPSLPFCLNSPCHRVSLLPSTSSLLFLYATILNAF